MRGIKRDKKNGGQGKIKEWMEVEKNIGWVRIVRKKK